MSPRDYDADDLKETTTLDDVEVWLEAITEAIDESWYEPTHWETEFLDSIREKVEGELDLESDGQPLTGKQLVSLRQIYDKVDG